MKPGVYDGTEKVVCPEVAVNSVTVRYAVVVTPDAGMPRKRTEMLPVPVGGAGEKVNVLPTTLYVLGSCTTPDMATKIELVPAGAADKLNAVVEPFPLNVSVRKATEVGFCPIYGMIKL
jgi:hypothetical protein